MEKDNNHQSEKVVREEHLTDSHIANSIGYNVETLVKKHEQWSENGSDECAYEEESYGSNNETYEEIHTTDHEAGYSTIYQDGSNHSDVAGLLPVSTVYSVTDYPHSHGSTPYLSPNHGHHPVVTTIPAVELGDNQTVQVQFEPDTVYTQVKQSHTFKYEPDTVYAQEVIGHQNIVNLPTTDSRSVQNDSDPHEKHSRDNEELNSTPTAHPDLSSLQALANTADPIVQNGIRVELQGRSLWRTFYEIGTEMIITKVGRRMFPAIRIKVNGLKPQRKYVIMLDIQAVDDNRYRYVYHSSKWMVAGTADNPVPPRVYVHPESPATGEAWMRQIVSFDKLKLTNHENDNQGHMILHSMHKYQPRLHVLEVLDENNPPQTLSTQKVDMSAPGLTTFIFRETQFITVTAYQNQQITRLKIDRNPFAKGFRNSGRNKPTQYDQNGPPMPGTYAAWRSSHLAASAAAANQNANSTKQSSDFAQVSPMTTPVTGWSTNQSQSSSVHHNHHAHYSTHHGAIHPHQKYATQSTYPSIQNLSPSALNTSILTYADPSDRHQIYHSGYSGYTIPQTQLQGDQKLEVTVLSTQLNNPLSNSHIHVARPQTGSKRSIASLTSANDQYAKEARYEDEYGQSDSPIQSELHPHSYHHYSL